MNVTQSSGLVHDRIATYRNQMGDRTVVYPVLAGQEPLPWIMKGDERLVLSNLGTVEESTDVILEEIRQLDGEIAELMDGAA